MENKTLKLVFTIVKPLAALVGFVSVLFAFIKIKGEILLDLGTLSVFKLLKTLSSLEDYFGSMDDVETLKKIILAAVAVSFVFTLLTALTSLLKSVARSIIPIVSSVLTVIYSILVIVIIPKATTDDWIGVSLCHAGMGYYISIATSVIVIGVCVFDLVLNGKGDSQSVTVPQRIPSAVPASAPVSAPVTAATPYAQDRPTTAFSRTDCGHIASLKGEYQGFNFPIENGEIIVIGRDPSKCQIVLTQSAQFVSGVHCSVKYENGSFYVCDYSKNGVLINKNRIPAQQWVCFPKGSVISLANDQIIFELC